MTEAIATPQARTEEIGELGMARVQMTGSTPTVSCPRWYRRAFAYCRDHWIAGTAPGGTEAVAQNYEVISAFGSLPLGRLSHMDALPETILVSGASGVSELINTPSLGMMVNGVAGMSVGDAGIIQTYESQVESFPPFMNTPFLPTLRPGLEPHFPTFNGIWPQSFAAFPPGLSTFPAFPSLDFPYYGLTRLASMWETAAFGPIPSFLPEREELGVPSSRAMEAASAVRDLTGWLNLSREDVAQLCSFSVRASYYWSDGATVPRPASVRRLFEVHRLVKSLIEGVGRRRALEWLASATPDGTSQLATLARDGGPAKVLRDASELLFATPPVARRYPVSEAAEIERDDEFAVSSEPELFAGPAKRRRRPSP